MQNHTPLISVIIPVYNVEEYLPRCVDSVINQTHDNLEILLVNDGSTDKSGEICDSFAAKDKCVRVIHQENAGVSAARNAGIDAASGGWIGFVDSDDWVEPDMYEKLLNAAISGGKQLAGCRFFKHCIGGWQNTRTCPQIPAVISRSEALVHLVNEGHFEVSMCNICNKIFQRDLFEEGGRTRLDTSLYYGEDLIFTTQALLRTDGLAYVSEALYHYCTREGSAMNSFSGRRLTELTAWRRVILLLEPVSKELANLAKLRYTDAAINIVYHAAIGGGSEHMSDLQQEARQYAPAYFLSRDVDLRMKIRSFAVLFAPKLSRRLWNFIKKRFNITWWYKELRQERNSQ